MGVVMIEVKQESDGKWGLYVNGILIGTSKLQCDALKAQNTLVDWACSVSEHPRHTLLKIRGQEPL